MRSLALLDVANNLILEMVAMYEAFNPEIDLIIEIHIQARF